MDRYRTPTLEHVLGDTWCIVTGSCRIPLYIPDRDNGVMIDSGLKNPDRLGILNLLEQEKIRIAAVLTSHCHRDHVGNHRALKDRHGAHIYMTPFASALCNEPAYRAASVYESSLSSILRSVPHESPTDHLFSPGDPEVTVAGYSFRILPLPGHAVEHTGFVTPDGVAYLGDTILSRPLMQSIRIPYFTCCKEDLQAKAFARELECPCYILAHNGTCGEMRQLAQENIDNIHSKLQMVESLAHSWITLDQLTARFIAHTGVDGDSLIKVIGLKRNLQVLIEYLQDEGRLEIRAKDGLIEYIKA